jgi:uncharacterized Tic20 family protein
MYELTTQDRNWSMLAHLSGGVIMFFPPFLGFIGPGLVWLINQDKPNVVAHARDAFKFQIAMTAAMWLIGVAGASLSCFLVGPFIWLLGLIPWIAGIGVPLTAAHRVNNGERFEYPITGDDTARLR